MLFLHSIAVHSVLAVLVTVLAIHVSKAQDLPFAFGTEVGDSFTFPNDDSFSSPLSLPLEMKFLGETVVQVFQNTNGDITFDSGYSEFTPELIPSTNVPPMVAIYWTDIDTRNGGEGQNELWIRAGTDTTDVETANNIVAGTGASFSAEAAIVATWNNVEAYNRRVGAQNTFQLTMAYSTEGETWAIFAYVQLEFFTTDTANRAVVGFNDEAGLIGELINSIEDVETMNLLLEETNCGIPGVFVYRVDEGIELSGCGILVEETDINPFQGPEEGGTTIQVANLPTCLDDDSVEIYCRFEFSDRTVIESGFRVSREAVECISPYVGFATTSALSYAVHVPVEVAFDPTGADWVEVRQPFQFFSNLPGLVLNDPQSFVLMADDDVELSWDEDTLPTEALESLNRILMEEDAVGAGELETVMEIHAYDEEGRKFDLVQSTPVAAGAGSAIVTVTDSALSPYYLSGNEGNTKAVVHVRIAYKVGERYGTTRGLHMWMGVLAPGQTGDRRLGLWCDAELALADLFCPDMSEIDIPPCPPTQPQAATNPDFAPDGACTWPDTDGDCDYFHNGAHGCYRGPGPGRTGSQCCYDETDSALILDPDQGAGTADCIAGSGGFLNIADHFLVDVWTYLVCCKFTDSCDDYFDRRPPTGSDGYLDPPAPPRNFGDPHFRTFDGLEYTFNGAGEFVAFCSDPTDPQGACNPSQTRLVAGRTTLDVQLRFASIGDGTATVAAAIGDPLHRNGEFGIAVVPHPSRRLDVFDGLDLVAFPDVSIGAETTALFPSGLRITRSADLTQATIVVTIFTPSGLIMRLTETNRVMLPSLFVTTGLEVIGSRGLYGVVDGDPTNDLMDPAGTVVEIDSSLTQAEQEELIFDLFGMTWMIQSASSSLFQALQDSDQEWALFYNPSYRPLFEAPALSPALQAQADAACGSIASDTIRAGCYFDIAISGDVETYSMAAMGAVEQQEIVETLLNTPPSLNMTTGSTAVVVGEIGSFELMASDPDVDDTLLWELRQNDEALFTLEGSVEDSRTLSFDTAGASEGAYRARVAVSDGTASAIFDATVTVSRRPPTVSPTDAPTRSPITATFPVTPSPTSEDTKKLLCFSDRATVQVEEHTKTVTMKNLKIGDRVLTITGVYAPVYAFGHRHETQLAKFLKIRTNATASALEMSGEHMVFVHGKKGPVRADSIKVGEFLVTINQEQQLTTGSAQVTHITKVSRKGLYAPLTPDGTIVVNGILASTYVGIQANANEYVEIHNGVKIPLRQADLQHIWLSPLRLLCTFVSSQLCEIRNENSMHGYVAFGVTFMSWAEKQHVFVQVSALALVLSGSIVFCAIEVLLTSIYGMLLLAAIVAWAISKKQQEKKQSLPALAVCKMKIG